MRFIAKYRRYKITAREHVKMTLANGKDNVIQHGVICEFQHGGTTQIDHDVARRVFQFNGTNQEEDQVTPVDPIVGFGSRISVYDTEWPQLQKQWAQFEKLENIRPGTIKAEVETFLTSYSAQGRDYVLVEMPKATAPFARWKELRRVHGQRKITHVIKDITDVYALAGFDVDQALAFERQEGNDPELIAALEALKFVSEDEAEPLIAA